MAFPLTIKKYFNGPVSTIILVSLRTLLLFIISLYVTYSTYERMKNKIKRLGNYFLNLLFLFKVSKK